MSSTQRASRADGAGGSGLARRAAIASASWEPSSTGTTSSSTASSRASSSATCSSPAPPRPWAPSPPGPPSASAPSSGRWAGAGVGYQLAGAVGGGFTPLIAGSLVIWAGGGWSLVAAYVALGCLVSFLIVLRLPGVDTAQASAAVPEKATAV